MCGLVGIYSSNMLVKHKDALADLLYLDTWRGRDSTGVAAIRHNADTAILKSTVPGYEFVEGPRLENHLKLNDFCWIGHNRYGTIGKNIRTNAHPFEILDEDGSCILVGAHNGTLKNKHALMDHAQFGTDSEALYNHIANTSLEETIPLIEGAWALTYYDHIKEELRFIRNKERPLFYAYEEGKKTLIWASEMWMIRVACSRSGIKLHEDKVFSFEEDTLYAFPAPEKLDEELVRIRKGGLVGKTPTFFQGRTTATGNRTSGHDSQGDQTPHKEATQANQSTSATIAAGVESLISQSGTNGAGDGGRQPTTNRSLYDKASSKVSSILAAKIYKGYQGAPLSKTELDNQLAGGCGWCETEFIDRNDRHAWVAPGKPVCAKCLDGTHDTEEANAKVSVH